MGKFDGRVADWSYFEFEVGRYLPPGWEYGSTLREKGFKPYKPIQDGKRLVWFVFAEDGTSRGIVPVNLFEYNWVFLHSLVRIKRKYGKDFVKFADSVRSALMSEYWSRCEYETVITTWPSYVTKDDVARMAKEIEERERKWGSTSGLVGVDLYSGVKIDVYTQVMLNWDSFIKYLWDNRRLITPKKLGLEPSKKSR